MPTHLHSLQRKAGISECRLGRLRQELLMKQVLYGKSTELVYGEMEGHASLLRCGKCIG